MRDSQASAPIVFRRPSFSRRAAQITMPCVVAALLYAALSSADLLSRVLLGFCALCALPFVLVVWLRIAQRVEVDAAGITIIGRIGRRHLTWTDYATTPERDRARLLPTYNWNSNEIPVPAAVADAEPLFELVPPTHTGRNAETEREKVQIASFVFDRSARAIYVRVFNAIFALRATDPTGDWVRQLATVFRARDRYNGSAPGEEMPHARVISNSH